MSNLRYQSFGDISVSDPFFDSLREDYPGFDAWFAKKGDEYAYVFRSDAGNIEGFLYLKPEIGAVDDVAPQLPAGKRLKIGTFKVNPHGTRLGERFMKKAFDHAVALGVDELYVTVFPKHARLVGIFQEYGFTKVAEKLGRTGAEAVMVRSLLKTTGHVVRDYPLIRRSGGGKFILSIYPTWHTRLLPDSKLNNEPLDIVGDVSHTNSVHKVYLTAMKGTERLRAGDVLAIYRTSDGAGPAHYRSVVTSICVVEEVRHIGTFRSLNDLLVYCAPYSVFTEDELRGFWTSRRYPILIRFAYNAALRKRLTRGDLIDQGVIDPRAYAGFMPLTEGQFDAIVRLGGIHAGLVVD